MAGRGAAGIVWTLAVGLVFTSLVAGCEENGSCELTYGAECEHRDARGCVEGCSLVMSCNPLACSVYEAEAACIDSNVCSWDGDDCVNPASCGALDEQGCAESAGCYWAQVCRGEPTSCDKDSKAECLASDFCDWSSRPRL